MSAAEQDVAKGMPPEMVAEIWRKHRANFRRLCGQQYQVWHADFHDLAQQVNERLLRYGDPTIAPAKWVGYWMTIALNVVREDKERSCNARKHISLSVVNGNADEHPAATSERDGVIIELSIDSPHAEDILHAQQCSALIQSRRDLLPARQRDILRLHVDEGLTYKQIAKIRGLTYRIVLRDLTRAYTQLRNDPVIERLRQEIFV